VKTVHVETAAEMLSAAEAALPVDVAVCAAAVADWRIDAVATSDRAAFLASRCRSRRAATLARRRQEAACPVVRHRIDPPIGDRRPRRPATSTGNAASAADRHFGGGFHMHGLSRPEGSGIFNGTRKTSKTSAPAAAAARAHRVALLARRAVGEVAHRIDRLARRPEVTSMRRPLSASLAGIAANNFSIAATISSGSAMRPLAGFAALGHFAFVRTDRGDPVGDQLREIAARRRMVPHERVHRRGEQYPLVGGDQHGRGEDRWRSPAPFSPSGRRSRARPPRGSASRERRMWPISACVVEREEIS